MRPRPTSTLFPYTTLFRSCGSTRCRWANPSRKLCANGAAPWAWTAARRGAWSRSEEHTSELQSHSDLVCRLPLEKKNDKYQQMLDLAHLENGCLDFKKAAN